jgi:hypothetical protein
MTENAEAFSLQIYITHAGLLAKQGNGRWRSMTPGLALLSLQKSLPKRIITLKFD